MLSEAEWNRNEGVMHLMNGGKKRPYSGKPTEDWGMSCRSKKRKNMRAHSDSCPAPGDDDHIFAPVHQRDDISLLTLTKQFVLEIKRQHDRLQKLCYLYISGKVMPRKSFSIRQYQYGGSIPAVFRVWIGFRYCRCTRSRLGEKLSFPFLHLTVMFFRCLLFIITYIAKFPLFLHRKGKFFPKKQDIRQDRTFCVQCRQTRRVKLRIKINHRDRRPRRHSEDNGLD